MLRLLAGEDRIHDIDFVGMLQRDVAPRLLGSISVPGPGKLQPVHSPFFSVMYRLSLAKVMSSEL